MTMPGVHDDFVGFIENIISMEFSGKGSKKASSANRIETE